MNIEIIILMKIMNLFKWFDTRPKLVSETTKKLLRNPLTRAALLDAIKVNKRVAHIEGTRYILKRIEHYD